MSVLAHSCKTKNIGQNQEDIATLDSNTNVMALYGKYLYKREGCNSCHTFDYQKNSSKISLDGIGKSYSNRWHYTHLKNPRNAVSNSKMPSYAYLADTEITMKALSKGLSNEINKTDILRAWSIFEKEDSTLSIEYLNYGITTKKHSEIKALIADSFKQRKA